MGKTKTLYVADQEKDALVGKEAYENRKKEKAKKEAEKIHIAGLKGGQRIKTIEVEPTTAQAAEETKESKKEKVEKLRSKKYLAAKSKVEKGKIYFVADAIKLAKETSYSSFDGSVELHIVVKKVGTSANVTLPFVAGKAKRIEVASDETIKNLTDGKIDFDILLATPEMMPKLVPFARTLGPKGLMPNPKNGTLISDIKKAKDFSPSSLNLKTEKEAPLIHTVVGKVSQKDDEIIENTKAIFKALGGEKQIVKAYAKASMGPSIKVSIA